MKVEWKHGLHLLPASRLARIAAGCRSSIRVICGQKAADAASVLSLLILGAVAGSLLTVEVSGEDEAEALQAVQQFFLESADL